MSSLPSKQIQTECLFDDPQPFFPPQNQKHNKCFFLFTFALFSLAESQTLLNVLLVLNKKGRTIEVCWYLQAFRRMLAFPLRDTTAIFVPSADVLHQLHCEKNQSFQKNTWNIRKIFPLREKNFNTCAMLENLSLRNEKQAKHKTLIRQKLGTAPSAFTLIYISAICFAIALMTSQN